MEKGGIVIITGSPGTGKTTAASVIAKESSLSRSVYIHTDDFYHYLSKGEIPPYLPESNEQNKVIIEAVLSAAKSFAHNGYDVIVDGIIVLTTTELSLEETVAGIKEELENKRYTLRL